MKDINILVSKTVVQILIAANGFINFYNLLNFLKP